jgi:hypothetical protein
MVASLIAHRGTRLVTPLDLAALEMPSPRSSTHRCVPHIEVVTEIMEELQRRSLCVSKESYSLSPDGNRFFGVLDTRDDLMPDGIGIAIGIRNSHDQSLALGIAAGTRVFVCDNLSFTGDVIRYRKHTTRISVRQVVGGAVEQVLEATHREVSWYERLRVRVLGDAEAKTVLIDALRGNACTAQQLPCIAKGYFDAVDQSRTAWSLYNAFTDTYRDQHPSVTLRRSRLLNAVFHHAVSRN